VETINQAIAQALEQAQLSFSRIDGIAATCAPGLVGALLVGNCCENFGNGTSKAVFWEFIIWKATFMLTI